MVLVGLGSLLGASWADLEASWGFWGPLGIVLGLLEVILEPLEVVLALLGVVLGPLEAVLEPLGMVLGRSWSLLGLSWGGLCLPFPLHRPRSKSTPLPSISIFHSKSHLNFIQLNTTQLNSSQLTF